MNRSDDESDEKPDLEALLRRWGAEQASQKATPPTLAIAARRPHRHLTIALRWSALAAAVVLAFGLGLAMRDFGWQRGRTQSAQHMEALPQAADRAASSVPRTQPGEQSGQLQEQLRLARLQLHDVQTALDERTNQFQRAQEQQRQLQTKLEKASGVDVAALRAELAAAKEAARAAKLQHDEAAGRAKELEARLADQAEKHRADARTEMLAAQEKLRQLQKQLADQQELTAAASAAAAAAREDLQDLQRAYLLAAAPLETGVAARQAAARQARLLGRLGALRKSAPADRQALLDKLEVVLLRLETLDASDGRAGAALARLLNESQALAELDSALAALPRSPLRQWLLEAKLVLAGAERVG